MLKHQQKKEQCQADVKKNFDVRWYYPLYWIKSTDIMSANKLVLLY